MEESATAGSCSGARDLVERTNAIGTSPLWGAVIEAVNELAGAEAPANFLMQTIGNGMSVGPNMYG
jgi:hypothetical protein